MARCRLCSCRTLPVVVLSDLVLVIAAAWGQEPPIEVNPNRPTFATPARTTQLGVAELEFGVQQSFLHEGRTNFSSPTLLKLGVATDFGLRFSTAGFLDLGAPGARSVIGAADQLFGAQAFGGEFYAIGGTQLNDRVVSNLWYVAYQPLGRLVLDTGVDIGLTRGAQRYSVFAGLT